VALQRDRARPEKTVAHHWVYIEAELRRELVGLGLWIDSATLDVEATVERILRGRAEALLTQRFNLFAGHARDDCPRSAARSSSRRVMAFA
jgi:hypothetical protein